MNPEILRICAMKMALRNSSKALGCLDGSGSSGRRGDLRLSSSQGRVECRHARNGLEQEPGHQREGDRNSAGSTHRDRFDQFRYFCCRRV